MTTTEDRRELYTNMADHEIRAINRCFDQCIFKLRAAGINTEGDDRRL